jgi:glycosyltransferase involved in cell wall biosynthesis
MNGVPVAASNLPGVRQPVTMTGMGEVTPIGDADALADALIRILNNRQDYLRPSHTIADAFSPDQTAREYVHLYHDLLHGRPRHDAPEPEAYQRLRQLDRTEPEAENTPMP